MASLVNSQSLILDLRQCQGGYPGMVALYCSYLFGEQPLHLVSIYWRDEDITQQYWTYGYIPGRRMEEKPIYVLTSKVTFSAGELFAYILQSRGRATIIGEKTDGGANPGVSYRLHPHIEVFMPIGRTIDPLSGGNWEGSGVTPDILTSPEDSLNTAYRLALQAVIDDRDGAASSPLRRLAGEARTALKGLQKK
jgi:C-terminal processing protease CtpA/Prc